ncbi:hypothetical protein Tco_0850199 [Tanacetum coccineum]
MSARIVEATALSLSSFRKRYRSSYETSSSSSPTLPVRKRYRGTSKLILDINSEKDELGEEHTEEDESDEDHGLGDESQGLEDEGLGLEKEEHLRSIEEITPSTYEVGQSSRSVLEQEGVERISAYRQPTLITWVDPETPPFPEWSLSSLPVSPSSPVAPSPIDSPVATSTATISVDKDQFIEVGAQLELYGSILYDHTQRLDALPPTLVTDINRAVRELYTRSGVVRDEIFSQRYKFRSLERKQERTAMTFRALWRLVLALEAWAGHQAAMQRELQEMKGRVAALDFPRKMKPRALNQVEFAWKSLGRCCLNLHPAVLSPSAVLTSPTRFLDPASVIDLESEPFEDPASLVDFFGSDADSDPKVFSKKDPSRDDSIDASSGTDV